MTFIVTIAEDVIRDVQIKVQNKPLRYRKSINHYCFSFYAVNMSNYRRIYFLKRV